MKRIGFLALAATYTLLALGLASGPLRAQATAPVAQWKLDEGSATVAGDASGNGNNGTLEGDAAWSAGLVGPHAVSFSGKAGSDVDIPKPVVDTTQSYTVMACVKLNQASGFQTFASIDGSQVSGFYLQFRDDTGQFAFTALPADAASGDGKIASALEAPETGIWYHLAGVHDAAAQTISLYVDGKLQQTVPFTQPWRAGGHTVIGRGKFSGAPADFVNGSIDDVRFYQAALPAAEILALAKADIPTAGMPPLPPAPAALEINANKAGARIGPMLYGLMTEEINYSYDGGLYAELIRNRIFKDDPANPVHWSLIQEGGAGTMSLDNTQPISGTVLTTSLKLDVIGTTKGQRVGVANDGYWGIPVKPNTSYRASFYAKASPGFSGPLTVAIESNDGATTFARAQVARIDTGWRKYTVALKTGALTPSTTNRFLISAASPGTIWFNLVSLFPPTYNNRPNGNRIDLMQKMAAMKPRYLRFPGGNYLEGNTIAERFDWKKTIGPLEQRPGHQGPWGYRSTDGMGLLEFLQWCEDLHMQPLLAVFAGYALNGEHVTPGPDLQPFVQDALDEIEYLTGDTTTKWGAERARNGHPKPFSLQYVEIGNEDFFDKSGSYDGRYAQFYDAIKARYPKLQLIATTPVKGHVVDVIDDHFYKTAQEFERDVHHYDNYSRTAPKIFVGEWASQDVATPWVAPETKGPTPSLNAALGDAAWMTGMERNADVIVMQCYAPLFVNVNPGGRQWAVNLIGYDALRSYGSPSYYAQVMFGSNVGDVVLPATLTGGSKLFYGVTRDTKKGMIYLKMVNAAGTPQSVHVSLKGAASVAPAGTAIVLSSASPKDTNTISDPVKIVPVTSRLNGLGANFEYRFAPYSVTVLQIHAR